MGDWKDYTRPGSVIATSYHDVLSDAHMETPSHPLIAVEGGFARVSLQLRPRKG